VKWVGESSRAVTIIANDIGPIGGMERQLTELVTGALRAGVEVTVISWTCSLRSHPNLHWIRVPGPNRPFALAYPLFLIAASLLVAWHRRGVLHCTGAIILNRVDVCTVHFCHQAMEEVSAPSRASRSGYVHRLNASLSRALSRGLEKVCYRPQRVQRLIGVSRGVCEELNRHFPAMTSKTTLIPNGVDTEMFRPVQTAARRGAPRRMTALFVGGEWERKGLRIAIEALQGTTGISLVVVGRGDHVRYAELASSLGVADRVEFAGVTRNVERAYRAADVFVLPTAYETFSLATYEAAASGLPLLVTRVNGVEDLLRDGENGWFIDQDPHLVRECLCTLHEDAGLRRRMGLRARADSLDFSWNRVVDQYLDLYEKLGRETSGPQFPASAAG